MRHQVKAKGVSGMMMMMMMMMMMVMVTGVGAHHAVIGRHHIRIHDLGRVPRQLPAHHTPCPNIHQNRSQQP
jgi:hypothetical protein